jgi:NADH-quinone oxidoreductase subunit N
MMNELWLEAAVAGLALLSLIAGAVFQTNARTAGRVLFVALAGLAAWSVTHPVLTADPAALFRIDDYALIFRNLALVMTALVVLLTAEHSASPAHVVTEHYALILLACVAALVLGAANDFLLLFVALELLTTATFVLVALPGKSPERVKAGVKYLIMGGVSTAFLVYGIAYVFGTTGSTSYAEVRAAFDQAPTLGLKERLGAAFVLVALGFKVAAVPAHMWAPDVYQGAPLPVTAFLSTVSKAAGFAALVRLVFDTFHALQAQLLPALLAIAAVTIVWGTLGALREQDFGRLLGYSSISHTGFLLLGAAWGAERGATAILFYLVQYSFSIMACFFVAVASLSGEGPYRLDQLAGLNRRAPWLSWTMAASLLSLAGLPPLSGFLGKYLLLASAPFPKVLEPAYLAVFALALIAMVASVVYYFRIIRLMWSSDGAESMPLHGSFPVLASVLVCVAVAVGLGLYPNAVLTLMERGVASLSMK